MDRRDRGSGAAQRRRWRASTTGLAPSVERRARAAPQPAGRGVRARRAAAVARRHRRGQRAGAAPRGLLPPGPPAHLRRRARPVLDGRAGRHDHRRRRAAPRRAARPDRRHRGAARAAERHAGDLQRRPLRADRAGHGDPAPPDPRRRRHRRDGLQRARRRHQGRRRRRVEGVQGRRGPGHRLDPAAQRVDQGGDGPPRGDLRPRRHDHRHGHRLPRHRRAAVGPPAVDAEHRRGAPGDGQVRGVGHADGRRRDGRRRDGRELADRARRRGRLSVRGLDGRPCSRPSPSARASTTA